MAVRPKRETINLSQYPNMVVIYLGMRVNTITLRHTGMRQYWRDFESLEAWSRSEPHRQWWKEFLRDSGGTRFWHETYFRRGGVEAVYIDMETPTGLGRFAPLVPAKGTMFSARTRAGVPGTAASESAVTEEELYSR